MQVSITSLINRKLWVKVHMYLALSLGLLFVIIGVTGSLSVYRDALDELLNPELVISAQGEMLSPDKILAAVKTAQPNRYGVWTLEMPRSAHGAVIAWFEKPRETVGEYYAPLLVAVNPYTAEVINSRFWGHTVTTWMLDLHTQLLLDGAGRQYVAALGVFLLVSVTSGLYLWWPSRSSWRQALTIRHDAGLMRFLFDAHKLLGVCSAGILILLAFTGFHLAYPPLLEALTASEGMGHGDAGPNVRSTAVPNNRPVSLAEAVLVARGLFPSSEVRRITTPLGDSGTYRINLRQRHEINQHHPFTTVWIDRWSGQIRDVRNPVKFSGGQLFTVWLWPVHTGEAFGENGRLLWFFAGFTPLLLFASGTAHYLYRQGLLADRPLDVPGIKRQLQAGLHAAYVLSLKLLRQLQPWLLRALKKLQD